MKIKKQETTNSQSMFATFANTPAMFAIMFFLSCAVCFGQNGNNGEPISRFSIYGGFTNFENRVNLLVCDWRGCGDNYHVDKEAFVLFGLGFDIRFRRLERLSLGAYYAYHGGTDQLFFNPHTFIGLRSKFYVLPKSFKERTSNLFDVYAFGQAGTGIHHRSTGTVIDFFNTDLGAGIMVYPVRNLGIYFNYAHSWFTKSILNQHFFHFGLAIKPKISFKPFR